MNPHPIHSGARRLSEAKRASLFVLLAVAAAPLLGSAIAIVHLAMVTRP